MKKNLIFIALFSLLFLTAEISKADLQVTDSQLKIMLNLKDAQAEKISGWELNSYFALMMVLAVGILSAVLAFLQKFDLKRKTIITALIGLFIAVITVIDASVLPDYNTLKKKVLEAEQIMNEIEIELTLVVDEQDKSLWMNNIREKLKKISEIEYELIAFNDEFDVNLVSPLYAQAKRMPEWISRPPEDDYFLYFLGEAVGNSLASAETFSAENAREAAVNYLVEQISKLKSFDRKEINHEKLSDYLINSAEIYRTYYEVDKNSRKYVYYTLLRLAKNLIEIDATFFALEKNIKLDDTKTMYQNIQSIKSPTNAYYSQRNKIYENLLSQAQTTLNQEDYKSFEKARQMRKEGNAAGAIPILENILNKYPGFYMGWYNAALAYDAVRKFGKADYAYKKAMELEPSQSTRDASIYNTYGYFLVQQGKASESEQYFRKTLEINPEHALARNNLRYLQYIITE